MRFQINQLPRIPVYIREVREKNGETAQQLAEELGINYRSLLDIETGDRPCTVDLLSVIAARYRVDIVELLDNSIVGSAKKADTTTLTTDERNLVRAFRKCDPQVSSYMAGIMDKVASLSSVQEFIAIVEGMDSEDQMKMVDAVKAITTSFLRGEIESRHG